MQFLALYFLEITVYMVSCEIYILLCEVVIALDIWLDSHIQHKLHVGGFLLLAYGKIIILHYH